MAACSSSAAPASLAQLSLVGVPQNLVSARRNRGQPGALDALFDSRRSRTSLTSARVGPAMP
jgi:hypothetical protein